MRVGKWLAVFQVRFNALLLDQWLGNGSQIFIIDWEQMGIEKGEVAHFSRAQKVLSRPWPID